MTLYHYGETPFGNLSRFPVTCDTDHKPGGLWLSEDSSDGWAGLSIASIRYKTAFRIRPSAHQDILFIRNDSELIDFVRRYRESAERNCSLVDLDLIASECNQSCPGQCFNCYGLHIVWGHVKSEYKGIAITPFLSGLSHRNGDTRFHWYRFDCASWCFWDTECLEQDGQSQRTT